MKKVFAISAIFLVLGCEKENRWDCFTSFGEEVTEYRPMEPFSVLITDSDIDIEYRYSEEYGAEVTFGDNVIKHIETQWTSGELLLTNAAKCNWVRDLSKKPKIVVYAPNLEKLENRGVGDIVFRDTLFAEAFTYEQWNANGAVKLLLNGQVVRLLLNSGITETQVSGYTDEARIYSSCGSKIYAEGLESPLTLVNNSSTQPMQVYSDSYLFARIGNRGDIRYAGNPDQIDQDISGTGQVLPL
jgi:hypothetical protein